MPAIVPPLGLAYLAGYLEAHGHTDVIILDARLADDTQPSPDGKYMLYGMDDDQVTRAIKALQPSIVGISCMWTAYAADAHRMAKLAKDVNKDMPVVFGGAHASQFTELVLKDPHVDIVVRGEGENTFCALVEAFKKGRPELKNIPGISWRDNGRITANPTQEYVRDLDSIPFPARHLLNMDRYLKETLHNPFSMRRPSSTLISSRGCPQDCVYCTIHSVWGRGWRARSAVNVVDEVEHLMSKYGIREFYFMDDSMTLSRGRIIEICRQIKDRKLDIRWTMPNGAAHWTLNKETISLMKESGCYRITFGIESGNPEVRKFIGKNFDLGQAKELIQYANRIGMWTICTFIIGFPYETKEQIMDTINFAVQSDTDQAVFYLLCPHPGTGVYEVFKKEGLLNFDNILGREASLDYAELSSLGHVLAGKGIRTMNFSAQELNQYLSLAYRKFFLARFFNTSIIKRLLRKIRSREDALYCLNLARVFMSSLFAFLRNKGFSSHSFRKRKK